MKKLIIYTVSALMLAGLIASHAQAFELDGYYAIKYDNFEDDNGASQVLKQYLSLHSKFTPDFSFTGLGSWQTAIHNEHTEGELYSGFFEYVTFERRLDIMLGRFDLLINRFMTLDGASVSVRTPYYFGFSTYVGEPRYKQVQKGDDNFRSTGDLLYGGSLFLLGVPNVSAAVNYSKESGKNDYRKWQVFRETLGLSASYNIPFSRTSGVLVEGIYDQDVDRGKTHRATGRFTAGFDQYFRISLFGDYFDVRDEYPAGRELIIRLLSRGLETRYGGSVTLFPGRKLEIFGGVTLTEIKMRGGVENNGQIYNMGLQLDYLEERGVIFGLDGYVFDSDVSTATGLAANVDWHIASDIRLQLTAEQAWMRNAKRGSKDDDVFSVDAKLALDMTQKLALEFFGQAGTNSRFADRYRWGMMVKYVF